MEIVWKIGTGKQRSWNAAYDALSVGVPPAPGEDDVSLTWHRKQSYSIAPHGPCRSMEIAEEGVRPCVEGSPPRDAEVLDRSRPSLEQDRSRLHPEQGATIRRRAVPPAA